MTTRILIADDDAFMRELVSMSLADGPWVVDVAQDGREALDLAAAQPPHLAILDLSMPNATGLQVAHELRAAPATRHAVIVLLTARGFGVDEAPDIDHYVAKPFSPRALRSLVESSLAGGSPEPG